MKIIKSPLHDLAPSSISFDGNTVLVKIHWELDSDKLYVLNPLDLHYSNSGDIYYTQCLAHPSYWKIKKLQIPRFNIGEVKIDTNKLVYPMGSNDFEVNFDPNSRMVQFIFDTKSRNVTEYISFAKNIICGISHDNLVEITLINIPKNIIEDILKSRNDIVPAK